MTEERTNSICRTVMRCAPILLLFFLLTTTAHAELLRVGVYQNEPKIFMDDQGVARGIFIELLEEMAAREGWTLVYIPCEWPDCLQALREGRIDLLPDVARTPERDKWFSFHTQPALHSWFQIYCPGGDKLQSLLDLNGRSIALLQGSVQQQIVAEIIVGFGMDVTVLPASSYEEAFQMVSDGIADVVIANHFFGDYQATRYGLLRSPVVFHPTPLFFAARKGSHQAVLDSVDRYLTDWKADPHSPYYRTHATWLGEPARLFVPRSIWWLLALLVGIAGVAVGHALLQRREVARRTRELADQNDHLKDVLAELTATRRKAAEQESLHILGQMASGIAHDFNNCLTLVLGHAELLRCAIEDGQADADDILQQLQIIEQAGHDGSAIVGRMRNFYKAQHSEEEEKDLALDQLADDVLHMTRPLWKTQSSATGCPIRLERHLAAVPLIRASPRALRQALLNVILNAVEAMPCGGTLKVHTSSDGYVVSLEVTDTGIGMTKEERANCLRPFYTTKAKKGTGMGLSMVESIVKTHGGGIAIRSEKDKGTTVQLTFPVATPLQPVPSTPAQTAQVG